MMSDCLNEVSHIKFFRDKKEGTEDYTSKHKRRHLPSSSDDVKVLRQDASTEQVREDVRMNLSRVTIPHITQTAR